MLKRGLQSLQLDMLWKILGEVDLDEIQADVERSFRVGIVAEDPAQGETFAALLSSDGGAFAHPWLQVFTPREAQQETVWQGTDLALLLSQEVTLSGPLGSVQDLLEQRQIETLVVLLDDAATTPGADQVQLRERGRILLPRLSDELVRQDLAPALVPLLPQALRLSLAYRLPPLRGAVYRRLIQDTSQANATYAVSTGLAEIVPVLGIPLNMADLIVLSKNQLIMAYKIALVAGKKGTPRELLGEIISVLGGGFVFRQLARELVGLIPVWGLIPKVAVAYAGTWTIGQAVVFWAVGDQRITPDVLSQYYNEALARGNRVARQLTGRLRQRVLPSSRDADV